MFPQFTICAVTDIKTHVKYRQTRFVHKLLLISQSRLTPANSPCLRLEIFPIVENFSFLFTFIPSSQSSAVSQSHFIHHTLLHIRMHLKCWTTLCCACMRGRKEEGDSKKGEYENLWMKKSCWVSNVSLYSAMNKCMRQHIDTRERASTLWRLVSFTWRAASVFYSWNTYVNSLCFFSIFFCKAYYLYPVGVSCIVRQEIFNLHQVVVFSRDWFCFSRCRRKVSLSHIHLDVSAYIQHKSTFTQRKKILFIFRKCEIDVHLQTSADDEDERDESGACWSSYSFFPWCSVFCFILRLIVSGEGSRKVDIHKKNSLLKITQLRTMTLSANLCDINWVAIVLLISVNQCKLFVDDNNDACIKSLSEQEKKRKTVSKCCQVCWQAFIIIYELRLAWTNLVEISRVSEREKVVIAGQSFTLWEKIAAT